LLSQEILDEMQKQILNYLGKIIVYINKFLFIKKEKLNEFTDNIRNYGCN
jgi:hypothetical protein